MQNLKYLLCIVAMVGLACNANPDNLKYEDNFLIGLEKGSTLNKPIFIHFTGHLMPYNEFRSDLILSKAIQDRLNEDFIVVELYIDYKKPIEKKDTLGMYTLGIKGLQEVETIGDVNIQIQTTFFQNNVQPFYVIMDAKRNELIESFFYTRRDKQLFLSKLEEGIKQFKK